MKDTYAVLRISGLQYLVREGDVVDVVKSKELRPEVLLLNQEGKLTIGTPIVEGTKIDIEVENEYNEKIQIRRYKSKSRYRRTKGFKYPMQRLVITGINKDSMSAKELEAKKVKKESIKKVEKVAVKKEGKPKVKTTVKVKTN
ncbi:MAG: 50S ribosomal protein L21 [bacterium]|nr:50S ribosomal protein L21 [bacterium]